MAKYPAAPRTCRASPVRIAILGRDFARPAPSGSPAPKRWCENPAPTTMRTRPATKTHKQKPRKKRRI